MKRALKLLFLFTIPVLTLTACMAKDVHFKEHAPYQAKIWYESPLLVIIPDDLQEDTKRIEFGGFVDKKKYDVYYGEALRHETEARFRKMFSRVAIITETDFAALELGDELAELDIDMNTEVDEEGDEEPIRFDDLVPEFLVEPEGYLLRVSDIQFAFEDTRPVIIFHAEFDDRAIDRTLLSGRLAGRGKTIQPSNTPDTQKRRLSESIVAASNAALMNLSDRIVDAIENDALPTRVRSADGE